MNREDCTCKDCVYFEKVDIPTIKDLICNNRNKGDTPCWIFRYKGQEETVRGDCDNI